MDRSKGFSLIEVLLAMTLVAVAGMTAVTYVTRAAGHADWASDKVFARQKALSILSEMRAFVEGSADGVAADLDGFDDGVSTHAALSIAPDPSDPGAFVPPNHPLSGNWEENGLWRWRRQISVRPFVGSDSRDLRICTVRLFRQRLTDEPPGEMMAEVAAVIRTVGESYPSTQVFDLYLLALENVPGWWVDMGAMRPFVEGTLTDLQVRNPGLEFRTHWITTLGYGRDEEYAPYTNEAEDSQSEVPYAYFYPGTMPEGAAAQHYYVPSRFRGRVNVDGTTTPLFQNGPAFQEAYVDGNGNGRRDPGERFDDTDGDHRWDVGNEAPYALADTHNHCMRHPDAVARFEERIDAGLAVAETPTWRLLLDQMTANPDRFHNAILVNLHGELLPMPPTRNISDPASDPERRIGWRAVTHPERLRPHRAPGAAAEAPAFRVHAWKSSFPTGHEALMTQREPLEDLDGNGVWNDGERFEDWNGNGAWDGELPMTLVLRDGDFSANPNAASNPSLLVQCLSGGIDADGDGTADAYDADFRSPPSFPEAFSDGNGDGIRQVQEAWLDLDGDGRHSANEPHAERDGDNAFSAASEALVDANANDRFDPALPAESFTDANGNGQWDPAEPYWDRNKNGVRDGPTNPNPPTWQAWDPAFHGNRAQEDAYVADYGEPFLDLDGDAQWDAAEAFFDANRNGVRDGGFERGEMWYAVTYDAAAARTILTLHATPLETPAVGSFGLPAAWRLYDYEYVPCPTPATDAAGGDRFARHLGVAGDFPKNTARWRIVLPVAAAKRAFESAPGRGDGDQADKTICVETRIGTDLETGRMWPAARSPQNVSRTYAWWCDDPEDVPFSERFQMRGDPRLSPYADTDRHGGTAPNGYNWFWDDLTNGSTDASEAWLALDAGRCQDGWLGRADHDVPRMLQWLRTALVRTESIYTTLTGFSYYYLSVGGDVGGDSSNGYPSSIPVDGLPNGQSADMFEDTITGCRKFIRSNAGTASGIRGGGYWWSKPFLGELFPDEVYASEWKATGNVRSGLSSGTTGCRLVRRDDITSAQLPAGTTLAATHARLAEEGSTSFFNIGTSSRTYHHEFRDGDSGSLVDGGVELGSNYGYTMPQRMPISRPFGLTLSGAGGVGDEFAFSDSYPRYQAAVVDRFYDHESGSLGSGLVRLQEPGVDPRGCYVVVNGLDRTIENGTSMIARWSILSLIHGFFQAGVPGRANRIRQLARVQIVSPTLTSELNDPSTITIEWNAEWLRWDGKPYTASYAGDFSESEADTIYVPLYSRDNGKTWLHLLDESPATPGVVPWEPGVGPHPGRTLSDRTPGPRETLTWNVPRERFPKGAYLLRIEAHRKSENSHYSMHMEKIYVDR